MKARNISVTFNVDVYDSRPWFQIPTAVAKLLGLKSGDVIAVSIATPKRGTSLSRSGQHGFGQTDLSVIRQYPSERRRDSSDSVSSA
jgi:hypothetical protein